MVSNKITLGHFALPHPPQKGGARDAASWDNKKWFQMQSLLVVSLTLLACQVSFEIYNTRVH